MANNPDLSYILIVDNYKLYDFDNLTSSAFPVYFKRSTDSAWLLQTVGVNSYNPWGVRDTANVTLQIAIPTSLLPDNPAFIYHKNVERFADYTTSAGRIWWEQTFRAARNSTTYEDTGATIQTISVPNGYGDYVNEKCIISSPILDTKPFDTDDVWVVPAWDFSKWVSSSPAKTTSTITYNLTHCTITPNETEIDLSTDTTFTITADTGYTITSATIAGLPQGTKDFEFSDDSTSATYTVSASETPLDLTITADAAWYTPVTYRLNDIATIRPSNKRINFANARTFTVTANEGYTLTKATISFFDSDGQEDVPAGGTFTLSEDQKTATYNTAPSTNEWGSVTIYVTGAKETTKIPVTWNLHGCSATPQLSEVEPASFVFSLKTDEGYYFDGATVLYEVPEGSSGGVTLYASTPDRETAEFNVQRSMPTGTDYSKFVKITVIATAHKSDNTDYPLELTLSHCSVSYRDGTSLGSTYNFDTDSHNIKITADRWYIFNTVPHVRVDDTSGGYKTYDFILDYDKKTATYTFEARENYPDSISKIAIVGSADVDTEIRTEYGIATIYEVTTNDLYKISQARYVPTPTSGEVKDLGQFILNIFRVWVTPELAGFETVKLGEDEITGVEVPIVNSSHYTIDFGYIYPEEQNHNNSDYLESELSIYLPFYGYEELDPKRYLEKNINLKYDINLFTGDSVIQLFEVNETETGEKEFLLLDSFTCNVTEKIPYIIKPQNPEVYGEFTNSALQYLSKVPYMIFRYPIATDGLITVKNQPWYCSELDGFSGYNEFRYVDLSGITATKDELEGLESQLRGGVIL